MSQSNGIQHMKTNPDFESPSEEQYARATARSPAAAPPQMSSEANPPLDYEGEGMADGDGSFSGNLNKGNHDVVSDDEAGNSVDESDEENNEENDDESDDEIDDLQGDRDGLEGGEEGGAAKSRRKIPTSALLSKPELSENTRQYFKSMNFKFRNYKPRTECLRAYCEPVKPLYIHGKMESLVQEEKAKMNVNILPVKMDDDLKRDIRHDMQLLDQETMRAMREIVNMKIQQEKQRG